LAAGDRCRGRNNMSPKILRSGHLVRRPVGVTAGIIFSTCSASIGLGMRSSCLSTTTPTSWSYLAEGGTAHGMSREDLCDFCGDFDIYFNLSNVNWIPELEQCRRRTAFGYRSRLHTNRHPLRNLLFTYGERVHQIECSMATVDECWLPTRQPVVADHWPVTLADASSPFSTVININWTSYLEQLHNARPTVRRSAAFPTGDANTVQK
jgi:hypothetical protein